MTLQDKLVVKVVVLFWRTSC